MSICQGDPREEPKRTSMSLSLCLRSELQTWLIYPLCLFIICYWGVSGGQKASLWESRREAKALRPEACGAGCSSTSHPIHGVDEREEEEKQQQQQKELFLERRGEREKDSAPATLGTKSV